MSHTFAATLAGLMEERGLDDFALAQRLIPRPWQERELTAEEERGRTKSLEAYEQNVYRWRTGKSTPRLAQVPLIAAALGVTVADLVPEGGSGD